jgi:RNA polymerase sigma factor (sigma-70 family)
MAQEKLVHANLRLVPSMARRVRLPGVEFADLLSEGYAAVLRSVEKFDVSRGLKFSTYACRAIFASFHRLARGAQSYHRRFPVQFDPELERSDWTDRRHEQQSHDATNALRTMLQWNWADLAGLEQSVIRERYLVPDGQSPRTLKQAGERLGLSSQRVGQIEKLAMTKLRKAIDQHIGA